jgi:hypothetical protein
MKNIVEKLVFSLQEKIEQESGDSFEQHHDF